MSTPANMKSACQGAARWRDVAPHAAKWPQKSEVRKVESYISCVHQHGRHMENLPMASLQHLSAGQLSTRRGMLDRLLNSPRPGAQLTDPVARRRAEVEVAEIDTLIARDAARARPTEGGE